MTKQKVSMFVAIYRWVTGYKEQLNYPSEFAIVEFSPTASDNGVRDNQNKIILHYGYDRFGNLEVKRKMFSKERVAALREVHRIPVYDKTEKEQRFPVFGKILPSEITFTSR